MKRLLLVLIILCCLCSCNERRIYKEVDGRQVEVIDNAPYTIRYVEFDGHEYIYFTRGHQGSLCHSPKCNCLYEYKK